MALSPMMEHYLSVKEKYKDCVVFYRLGDFYEMFFDDAVRVSQLLDLTLTGRDCGLKERAPMCGIPYHAADGYIAKLVAMGERVAICEQLTEPGAGKMVERDVVRIVSAGTVTEESQLDEKNNNFIACAYKWREGYALAWADITTGEFRAAEFAGREALLSFLVNLSAAEIICNDALLMEVRDDLEAQRTLPAFTKGESGPHAPTLTEKWTTPPKYYTEATLLRAMETAGKFVDDEELRAALKENGIGRPSSRANIIETLFKRRYIKRERKNIVATPTGIELIDTIKEDLLKSCELTGIWEKKLRDIEHRKYDAGQFINELKQQITTIVNDVLADNSNRHVTTLTDDDLKKKTQKKSSKPRKATTPAANATAPAPSPNANALPADDSIIGTLCPVCGKGHVIKGKTAYGCDRWREGCTFRLPFKQ